MYGDDGKITILSLDRGHLESDVIHENLAVDNFRIIGGETNPERIENIFLSNYKLEIDEEIHDIDFKLKFSEDYSKAELVELHVNNTEINLK